MTRLNERDLSPIPNERMLDSIRAVMARAGDVIWQADAAGNVTSRNADGSSPRSIITHVGSGIPFGPNAVALSTL